MSDKHAFARHSLNELCKQVERVSLLTEQLPCVAVFRLYATARLDDAMLERIYDRLDRMTHWLSMWRDWRSVRSLQGHEIERVRVAVEELQPSVDRALAAVKELMGAPGAPSRAEERLLLLRVGIASLVDSRKRILTVDRHALLSELEILLEQTAWPPQETAG